MNSHEKWGLTDKEKRYIESGPMAGRIAGRVVFEGKNSFDVAVESNIVRAVLSGKAYSDQRKEDDYPRPVAGDWVWLKPGSRGEEVSDNLTGMVFVIDSVFPRRSLISRKSAGEKTVKQPLAANIDIVFIIMALDGGRNFNLRALERYTALAWDSGAKPVVILNKSDLCPDADVFTIEAETAAPGVSVIPVSAFTGEGIPQILSFLEKGITAVFIGPSGAGKSTITNYITGSSVQQTGEIRNNDKRGRHTTSGRELFQVPSGGVIIDTPGLREIQLWIEEESLGYVFAEIDSLAKECRFSDCTHTGEPGCAVSEALVNGLITSERYESYLKLRKEVEYTAGRRDQFAQLKRKEKWKKIALMGKEIQKSKRGKW